MALGADRQDVLRLVVAQGMRPVVAGIAVGLAISVAVTRLIAGILYEVSATDPLTFGSVALALAVTALVATLVPAARAGRLDPSVTLRRE